MNKISKILVILAAFCMVYVIGIRALAISKIRTGSLFGTLPINWSRLTDTFLLFAIALSLLSKNKKQG